MMATRKAITLDNVLLQFNPFHDANDSDAMRSAIGVNAAKREVFNDLLINVMDPEHQDVRQWDERRWNALVAFAGL